MTLLNWVSWFVTLLHLSFQSSCVLVCGLHVSMNQGFNCLFIYSVCNFPQCENFHVTGFINVFFFFFLFSFQFKAKGRVYRSMMYEPKALQKMNSKVRDELYYILSIQQHFFLSFELILLCSKVHCVISTLFPNTR